MSFTRSLYIEDVYDMCEKVFKINPVTELAVCQKGDREAHYYVFGVKNEEIWNRLQMDRFVGERILLTTGRLVYISYAFETYSDITVKHEPMKFTYTDLKGSYEKVWNGN